MREGGGIDDDAGGIVNAVMDPVDNLVFTVGLVERNRVAARRCPLGAHLLDILEARRAVDLGLPRPQSVEIGAVQDQYRLAHEVFL